MEETLATVLDRAAKADGVRGILLADEKGLCLGARGIASPSSAGFVASVAAHARDLYEAEIEMKSADSDGRMQSPTITVEADDGSTIIIRNEGLYTLAIFK